MEIAGEMGIMAATETNSPFGIIEIKILSLLADAEDIKVTRIAEEIGKAFDVAYGLCLLLSDHRIVEVLHDGNVPLRYAYSSVEEVGFHLTEKGRNICKTYGK